jgi:cell division protein FtsW (lipid II flippase)
MDANERWRRASESADCFSPFRRRPPVFAGLLTALVALISLAIFLVVAGLDIRQFWIAALVSVAAMMLAGSCFTLLSNHKAKSSYIGEYHRLNKINPVSDHVTRERRGDRGVDPVIARKRSST